MLATRNCKIKRKIPLKLFLIQVNEFMTFGRTKTSKTTSDKKVKNNLFLKTSFKYQLIINKIKKLKEFVAKGEPPLRIFFLEDINSRILLIPSELNILYLKVKNKMNKLKNFLNTLFYHSNEKTININFKINYSN